MQIQQKISKKNEYLFAEIPCIQYDTFEFVEFQVFCGENPFVKVHKKIPSVHVKVTFQKINVFSF